MKEKLTKEGLDQVRNYLVENIIRNGAFMFSDEVRGDENKISNEPDLIEVIVALKTAYTEVAKLLDSHIAELKGENNE